MDYPEIKYSIIGSGPLEKELKELAKSLNLQNNINFLGNLSDDSLNDESKKATIFMLPCVMAKNGDMDGIPVALMESMYLGIPVVSTTISGIPELIKNGKEGILVEPKNVEQLTIAMKLLLKDKELRFKIGLNGRKKIKNDFNIQNEINKLFEIWEKVV
jgi:glycosyltransferase involved in cell wall biosynthesis